MTIEEEFQKAITAHSHWKYLLREAIRTGNNSLMIKDVKNPHLCELGKWLDSPTGKILSNRAEIIKIHQDFHEEAAHILTLAVNGKKKEAEARMQLGSYFSQLTAKLINKLVELRDGTIAL